MTTNIWKKENIMKEIDELICTIKDKLHKSILLSTNKKLAPLPQPKILVGGQLKEYQLQSLAWMVELANNKLSGILADDMGLGKTIQAISYMSYIQEVKGIKGKHLIVVPKNVLNNWKKQLQKWNPQLQTIQLPGTQFEREQCLKKYVRPSKFDVLIATYQSVKSALTNLKKFYWQTLIVDEAHSIKNEEAQLSICLRRLNSKFCLLLTGTPLSNQLKQLWSLLNFIIPQIFSDSSLFKRIQQSVNFECKNQDQKIKYQSEIAGKFKAIIKPFLLRRVKSQIKLGLKQKKQFTLFVSLTELQLKMYRNFLKTSSVYGSQNYCQCNRQMQLRKICAHPYLFGEIQDPKAPPYGDHIIQNSGKLKLLDKLLNKLLKQNHKILIFSQFVIFLKILEDYCIYRKYKYSIITGQSSLQTRDETIQTFSNTKDTNLFLISTRAGGLGLNLVAADVVILYDLDWNPQIDKQATDRAYRIGQTKNVLVFKFVTNNTIEERILQVQKYKLIWDQLVIQKGGLAKIKAAQQKFQKINHNQLAGLGAEQIFKLQLNYDDKTIDQIIRIGQEKDKKKTQQIRAKLQKQFKTYGDIQNPFQNLLKNQPNIKDIKFQLETLGNVKKPNKPLSQKKIYIQPEFYHLYSDNNAAGKILYQMQQNKQNNKDTERENIKKLQQLGFYSWSKQQYIKFIQANQMYEKQDLQSIAKFIKSKPLDQVKKYSQRFFQLGNKNPNLSKEFKRISKIQQDMEVSKKLKILQDKIEHIPENIFNLKPHPRLTLMTSQALVRMYYNTLTKNGISIDEHSDVFKRLVPNQYNKVQKSFKTDLNKINNYSKIINQIESKSQEQIMKQMKKKYQELQKIFYSKSKKQSQKNQQSANDNKTYKTKIKEDETVPQQ